MPFTHDDINMIKKEVFAEADQRYVHVDDCNETQKSIDERLSKGDKQFAIINLKLSIMTWGIGIIATAAVSALVKEILELVLKG